MRVWDVGVRVFGSVYGFVCVDGGYGGSYVWVRALASACVCKDRHKIHTVLSYMTDQTCTSCTFT